MKLILVMIIFMAALCSCKDHISYQLRIMLKNETSSDITVSLFPKKQYISGNLYTSSSIATGHRETSFQISPDRTADLYTAGDLNLQPDILASTVFDSIYIETNKGVIKQIKFSPRSVTGYTENLFENMSYWNFEIWEIDVSSSVKRTCESHDYIFSIVSDKIQ